MLWSWGHLQGWPEELQPSLLPAAPGQLWVTPFCAPRPVAPESPCPLVCLASPPLCGARALQAADRPPRAPEPGSPAVLAPLPITAALLGHEASRHGSSALPAHSLRATPTPEAPGPPPPHPTPPSVPSSPENTSRTLTCFVHAGFLFPTTHLDWVHPGDRMFPQGLGVWGCPQPCGPWPRS